MKTHRELQFENEYVCVWKTVISPEEPLEPHQHGSGRVIIPLQGGQLKRIEQCGRTTDMNLELHKAYWLHADKMHGNVNVGDTPVEILVVEMKQTKNRPLPSKPID